ncbi:cupin domain-containing protein [Phenylobacterium sp. Root700]|uniref:(R)-mandelonitrile lyase n=1 Tax=Phenylobacterium sp. Root700 TaxID=1736591 RepID=UPI0006FF1901|nr:cupin domain-containing protein [Phenylobacterium sp. Root700]KRB49485.1 cupin [Phenylobacterium sp. Root700]
MRTIAAPVACIVLAASAASAQAMPITIDRSKSEPPVAGAPNFTGAVSVSSRFQRQGPARVGGGVVRFERGARTAWHTHPLGQTLFVTTGVGQVQKWGGPVEEIRPGDVVWIPPGVKHWHGATPWSGMTHIAVSETLDGRSVVWMEAVSDEDRSADPDAGYGPSKG